MPKSEGANRGGKGPPRTGAPTAGDAGPVRVCRVAPPGETLPSMCLCGAAASADCGRSERGFLRNKNIGRNMEAFSFIICGMFCDWIL